MAQRVHWRGPWKAHGAVILLLLRRAVAPIPCGTQLTVEVSVGENVRMISLSRGIESNTLLERACSMVNNDYEGMITMGCWEGELNATAEECGPKRCTTYNTLSVRVGGKTFAIYPLNTIFSGGKEIRLCREVNAMFRGRFILQCSFGTLSAETTDCVTQWDPLSLPPWQPRSRHAAVGLSDGSLLVLGGLGFSGPIQEVWQWTPRPAPEYGAWGILPEPPWSGRFGAAAIRLPPKPGAVPPPLVDSLPTGHVASGMDQVMLLGGNDGLNRRDVWLWDRAPSLVPVYLDLSYAVGTQPEDCTVSDYPQKMTCRSTKGVIGRKWDIAGDVLATETDLRLQQTTELYIELRYDNAGGGNAILALQLNHCRLLFELQYTGVWVSKACGEGDPRIWNHSDRNQEFISDATVEPKKWQMLKLVMDRVARQVTMVVDGRALQPVNMDTGALLPPIPTTTTTTFTGTTTATAGACLSEGDGTGTCKSGPPSPAGANAEYVRGDPSALLSVEVAVWPGSSIEVRNMSLMTLAGNWRLLAEEAPWQARTSHAAVGLPEGDILLMGGLSSDRLLNDVWRWTPKRCTLLQGMGPVEAVYYELECSAPCKSSVPNGQWVNLGVAPWLPRQGHSALYTSSGILMMGGRTDLGFANDVWKYTTAGSFCSLSWQGRWEQVTRAAAWAPRYGQTVVGFAPTTDAIETVLLMGGFGGDQLPGAVTREPQEQPIANHNDIWCGYAGAGNYTKWTQLTPESPFSKRSMGAVVVAPTVDDFAFVFFGGYDVNARHRVDFWRWQGENATRICQMADEVTAMLN